MMMASALGHLRKWLLPTLAATLFVAVLLDTFVRAPGLAAAQGWPWWELWFTLCSSSLIALCFVAAGTLVWLYERQRLIAFVVFAFCGSLMLLFLFETLGLLNDPWGSFGGSTATSLTSLMLLFLALIFPRNRLKRPIGGSYKRQLQYWGFYLLLGNTMLQGIIATVFSALHFLFARSVSVRYGENPLSLIFAHSGVPLSTVLTILFMAHSLLSARTLAERQQLRIMVWGLFGAYLPVLVLTAFPTVVAATVTQKSLIDVRLSTLSLVLLPLAISYAVLRYRLLILDRFIVSCIRSIAWLIIAVLFSYLAVTLATALFVGEARLLSILLSLVGIVPSASWLSQRLARWVLSPDITHSHHLLYEQEDLPHAFSVTEVATLFCITCHRVLGSDRVILFLLDSDAGAFQGVSWSGLASEKLTHWPPGEAELGAKWRDLPPALRQEWLEDDHPFVHALLKGKRPVLLGETGPIGWSQALLSVSNRALVVPLTIHDTLLGFGLLGSREETSGYAGPEMSVADTISSVFAPRLEEAIMTRFLSQRETALQALSAALNDASVAHASLEEMATVIAPRIAAALQVQCEVWKYVPLPQPAHIRHLTSSGTGPALSLSTRLPMASESDWHATFWEGSQSVPDGLANLPHLLHPPTFPVAWLPLTYGPHRYGMLVLTYDRPHRFSPDEQHVLRLLGQQWAGAMEQAGELEVLQARLRVHHQRAEEKQRAYRHTLLSVRTTLRSVQWLLSGQSPHLLSTPVAENRASAPSRHPFLEAYEPQLRMNEVGQVLLATRQQLVNGSSPMTPPGEPRAHRELLLIVGTSPLQALLMDAGPLLGYIPTPVPTVEAGFARLHQWSQHDSQDRVILVLETMLRRPAHDIRSFARMLEHLWREQGDQPVPALVVIREQGVVGETLPVPTLVLPFSLVALKKALEGHEGDN